MKKNLISFVLVIALFSCIVPMTAGAASVQDFSDVKPGAWYYDAVDYAAANGLFSGTSKTKFSPESAMTRGMFVTVLGRKAEVPDTYGRTMTTPFNDVTQADYYFPYAVWANDNGIVAGVGNKLYNPSGKITREQMATILYRYAKFAGYDISYTQEKYDSFPDTSKVSAYAAEPLKWATAHGVISGTSGTLSPQSMATRAQVAQIFLNFSMVDVVKPDPKEPTPVDPNPDDDYNPAYARPTGKSETDSSGGYFDHDLANEIMDQINALRAENTLSELQYHPKIQEWASIRAKEHTSRNGHTRPDGFHWSSVGQGLNAENLLYANDFTEYYKGHLSEYAAEVVDSWYGSDGHRNSMMNATFHIGAVSCYVKGDAVYIAHLFSRQSLYYMDYVIAN